MPGAGVLSRAVTRALDTRPFFLAEPGRHSPARSRSGSGSSSSKNSCCRKLGLRGRGMAGLGCRVSAHRDALSRGRVRSSPLSSLRCGAATRGSLAGASHRPSFCRRPHSPPAGSWAPPSLQLQPVPLPGPAVTAPTKWRGWGRAGLPGAAGSGGPELWASACCQLRAE